MFRPLKKVVNRCNNLVGVSLARTYLYQQEKARERTIVTADPDTTWALMLPEQAGLLSQVGLFDPKDLPRLLARGDLCYLGRIGDRVAHYSWVQRSGLHRINEAGLSARVKTGEFWIYYCVTADWARGRGLYPATLQRIVSDHFAEGYSAAWIYTSKQNVASQNGIVRAGFVPVGTFRAVRIGNYHHPVGRGLKPATSNVDLQLARLERANPR